MANNALQIPVQIGKDAARDVCDGINGCTNTELIAVGAVLGIAVVFTPHILALNGALSIFGSAGRAGRTRYMDGRCYCMLDNGREVELSPAMSMSEITWDEP